MTKFPFRLVTAVGSCSQSCLVMQVYYIAETLIVRQLFILNQLTKLNQSKLIKPFLLKRGVNIVITMLWWKERGILTFDSLMEPETMPPPFFFLNSQLRVRHNNSRVFLLLSHGPSTLFTLLMCNVFEFAFSGKNGHYSFIYSFSVPACS